MSNQYKQPFKVVLSWNEAAGDVYAIWNSNDEVVMCTLNKEIAELTCAALNHYHDNSPEKVKQLEQTEWHNDAVIADLKATNAELTAQNAAMAEALEKGVQYFYELSTKNKGLKPNEVAVNKAFNEALQATKITNEKTE